MQAIVIGVQRNRLLVLDLETRQRVIVHTPMPIGSARAMWFGSDTMVL